MKKSVLYFLLIGFVLCAFTACFQNENIATNNNNSQEPAAANAQAPVAQPGDTNAVNAAPAANAAPAVKEDAAPKRDDAAFAKLLNPAGLNETAPAQFNVIAKTTKGNVKIELHRDWSPQGVDRFYNLVKSGYFTDIAMFRMVRGFVVQFGIHGSPLVSDAWIDATIPDEPVQQTNAKGTITFAKGGPNSRTTQLFINLADNGRLDQMGFPPIGKIVEGMDVIESLNFEYAERPNQGMIHKKGNEYLKSQFPNLDYIISMSLE